MVERYKFPAMASIDDTAEALHAAGVMDTSTHRRLDGACLCLDNCGSVEISETKGRARLERRVSKALRGTSAGGA
jgi:hypothetical protein